MGFSRIAVNGLQWAAHVGAGMLGNARYDQTGASTATNNTRIRSLLVFRHPKLYQIRRLAQENAFPYAANIFLST